MARKIALKGSGAKFSVVVNSKGKHLKLPALKLEGTQAEVIEEILVNEDDCKVTIEPVQGKLFDGDDSDEQAGKKQK